MSREPTVKRRRMTSTERREQLIDIGRQLFAAKGMDGTTVEEIAARAEVSKPVVYEHFGGKEGLYAVVVDRETVALLNAIRDALGIGDRYRMLVERAALALLDYIDDNSDGFRILVRDAPLGTGSGSYSSILSDIAGQVEHILADEFASRGLDRRTAPMYAQMLVGMIAFTGQWWLETRKPRKPEVAAHLVNLAWNGLSSLERRPSLHLDEDD
ncbi:TetR family transcriptional regulator [Microlunatus sp. Y2014]|uniref:TetR family transcriptional regulator n=1 Tax=Microlunatus sp. Y2014 TaxID=3418488 RepID=UPI003DA7142B